jgi:hypothetical protein
MHSAAACPACGDLQAEASPSTGNRRSLLRWRGAASVLLKPSGRGARQRHLRFEPQERAGSANPVSPPAIYACLARVAKPSLDRTNYSSILETWNQIVQSSPSLPSDIRVGLACFAC